MKAVTVVEVDDWAAVYVDGRLKMQNHSIRLRELARLMNGEAFILVYRDVSEEVADNVYDSGYFPNNLADLGEE